MNKEITTPNSKEIIKAIVLENASKGTLNEYLRDGGYVDNRIALKENEARLKAYTDYIKNVEATVKDIIKSESDGPGKYVNIEKNGYQMFVEVTEEIDYSLFLKEEIKNASNEIIGELIRQLLPYIKFQKTGTVESQDENGNITTDKSPYSLEDVLKKLNIVGEKDKETLKHFTKTSYTTNFKVNSKDVKAHLKTLENSAYSN